MNKKEIEHGVMNDFVTFFQDFNIEVSDEHDYDKVKAAIQKYCEENGIDQDIDNLMEAYKQQYVQDLLLI